MFRRRMPVLFVEVEVEIFLIRRKWLLINDDKGTDKEVYSSYCSSFFSGFLRCSFRCCILMIWTMIRTITWKIIRRMICRMFRRRVPVLFVGVEVEIFLIRRKWLLINEDKGTNKEVYSSHCSSSFFALFVVVFVVVFWWFGWWFGRWLEDNSGGDLEDDSEEDAGFIRWSGTKIKEYRQRFWQ